jgi:transcriptional regulator with XRE-family HTH domain
MKNDFYERNFIMNEYFGKNIRALRKGKNLTQEQFAEKLGVSFQSVSRWENCVTYPDVEMIPLIARFFNVSTDYLFGIPEEKKKEEFGVMMNELKALKENDTEAAIQTIRTVRTEFDVKETFADLCISLLYSPVKKTKALTDELRRAADAFFESDASVSDKNYVLSFYARLEEEQYIPALIETCDYNTRLSVLYERYLYRGELDKAESYRQRKIFIDMELLFDEFTIWKDCRKPADVKFNLWKNDVFLDFLHGFTSEKPTTEHPVTCGLKPDVFAISRTLLGMRRACYLSALGKEDDAYKTLDDTVSLIEQIALLPDGTVIESRCPAMPDFRLKIDTSDGFRRLYYAENIDMSIREARMFRAAAFLDLMTGEHRWAGFDPIRNDERFKALAERVKNLI